MRSLRVLTIVLLGIATGCSLPLDGSCINETRILYLEGALEATASSGTGTGTVIMSLHEARDHRSKQTSQENIHWSVRASGIDRSAVSAVHVHERDTNQVLIQIPLENTTAPGDVVTQIADPRPHNGIITQWSEVYELLGSGRGYLDVHIGASGSPAMRANLAARNPNWNQFTHASCS